MIYSPSESSPLFNSSIETWIEGSLLRIGRRLILITIGFVIFAVYLILSNPLQGIQEAGHFDPTLFALAFLVDIAGLLLFGISWHLLLRGLDVAIGISESLQATFISFFVVWLIPVPIGSEIIRAYLVMDKENSDVGKAITSVLIHKAFYNISFGLILTIAALIITQRLDLRIPLGAGFIWFVVLFSAGSTIFFLSLLDTRILRWVYNHSPSLIRRRIFDPLADPDEHIDTFDHLVEEIGKSVNKLKSRIKLDLVSFVMIAFHWSSGSITTFLVGLSLGFNINIWEIVLIYAVVEFIQQLNFVIPGGIGIIDAGLTGALVLIGIPLPSASAISILTRLNTYWFELVLSAFVSLQFGYRDALKRYLA